MREMHRRCNYNQDTLMDVSNLIEIELLSRELMKPDILGKKSQATYYEELYRCSGVCSIAAVNHITNTTVKGLDSTYLGEMSRIINMILEHKSFELVSLHDAFSAHANNVNQVRYHYKEILAELADSITLSDVLTQINPRMEQVQKLSNTLSEKIRQSSYALT